MNTLKKALHIGFGVMFFALGIGVLLVAIFVQNVDPSYRILAGVGGVFWAAMGWWLIRRASNSVWEAISWLLANLIP